jgi:hypothetical protein
VKWPDHPRHVETVAKQGSREVVIAKCSCGWSSKFARRLGHPATGRLVISDFNSHRADYVRRDSV